MLVVVLVSMIFPVLLGALARIDQGLMIALLLLGLLCIATVIIFLVDRSWRRWGALVAVCVPLLGLVSSLIFR